MQFLSSELIDQSQIEKDSNVEKQQSESSYIYFIKYLLTFIYIFLILFILMIFMPLFSIMPMYLAISQNEYSYIFMGIWMIISGSSILFSLIMFFFIQLENDYIHYLFQDGIYFFFSFLLVATYLIVNTVIIKQSMKEILLLDRKNIFNYLTTVNFSNKDKEDKDCYFLDYNLYVQKIHYISESSAKEYPILAVYFSYFTNGGELSKLDNNLIRFYDTFTVYLYPNIKHFLILSGVLVIKIIFVFVYINDHQTSTTEKDIINVIMIFFVYLNITFLLNKTLGNNDLRRKKRQMQVFNDFINFQDVNEANYKSKLDITCPVSVEAWDNAKKYILSYKKEFLADLEIAYFCLIFYYFFVSIVCSSYYFDLNWLIPQDSQLLDPIIVIMSSFNFIFLTTFLIFRFQSGTEFNDSFGDIEQSMTYLLDIVQDLDTMYNKLFNQLIEDEKEVKKVRYSTYGLIIKRIKLLSKHYIKNQIKYQNKIYQEDEKENIRRKIIKEIKKNLFKIQLSIQTDKELFKYKFVNLVEVDIKDFLFTLTIGLVTTLPTIVPKFIDFYKQKE